MNPGRWRSIMNFLAKFELNPIISSPTDAKKRSPQTEDGISLNWAEHGWKSVSLGEAHTEYDHYVGAQSDQSFLQTRGHCLTNQRPGNVKSSAVGDLKVIRFWETHDEWAHKFELCFISDSSTNARKLFDKPKAKWWREFSTWVFEVAFKCIKILKSGSR